MPKKPAKMPMKGMPPKGMHMMPGSKMPMSDKEMAGMMPPKAGPKSKKVKK